MSLKLLSLPKVNLLCYLSYVDVDVDFVQVLTLDNRENTRS